MRKLANENYFLITFLWLHFSFTDLFLLTSCSIFSVPKLFTKIISIKTLLILKVSYNLCNNLYYPIHLNNNLGREKSIKEICLDRPAKYISSLFLFEKGRWSVIQSKWGFSKSGSLNTSNFTANAGEISGNSCVISYRENSCHKHFGVK